MGAFDVRCRESDEYVIRGVDRATAESERERLDREARQSDPNCSYDRPVSLVEGALATHEVVPTNPAAWR